MAIEVSHKFISAKGDGSDATLVRPSNWNDFHYLKMATARIIGRLTAGPGDAEEIPATAYMLGLLNTADYANLAIALGLPTTGDARLTYKVSVPAGWIFANDGTIGDAASGASVTNSVNYPTQALFTHFYNVFADAVCPLQTSTGVSTTRAAQGTATVAFNSHCRMVIPKNLGRAIIIAGTGAGLSARGLAGIGGEESHQLTQAETPDHTHFVTVSGSQSGSGSSTSGSASVSGSYSGSTGTISADHTHNTGVSGNTGTVSADHSHTVTGCANVSSTGGGGFATGYASPGMGTSGHSANHVHGFSGTFGSGGVTVNHTHAFSGTVNSSGSASVNVNVSTSGSSSGTTGGASGAAWAYHNNMQPWTAWNIMIRL